MQKYLIPKAQRHSGVQADKLSIKEDALNILIKSYCRESGVRNLEKQIEKVRNRGWLYLMTVYRCKQM